MVVAEYDSVKENEAQRVRDKLFSGNYSSLYSRHFRESGDPFMHFQPFRTRTSRT